MNPLIKLKILKSRKDKEAILGGVVKATIKEVLRKAGKLEAFDPKVDYDRAFLNMSRKFFNRAPIRIDAQDQEDLILNALFEAAQPKNLRVYDPKKSDIIKFLGNFFQQRLINELRKFVKIQLKEQKQKDESEFTEEEQLEFKRQKTEPRKEGPGEILEFKDLVKSLTDFIARFSRKKGVGNVRLVPIFNLLMKGKSNTEMARALKVGNKTITDDLVKLKKLIVEYAKRQDNTLLESLMKKRFDIKSNEAAKDKDWLIDVFKEYKKKTSKKIEPVGEITKIKKIEVADKLTEDYISSQILSEDVDNGKIASELDEYVSALGLQDEIIQADGKLICLQVVSEEIRESK
jgi:hypothetical protein